MGAAGASRLRHLPPKESSTNKEPGPLTTAFFSFDPGYDAPVPLAGATVDVQPRRKVNLRWLLGTVLTGVTGATLMLMAASSVFDPRRSAIEAPQFVSGREVSETPGQKSVLSARRSDKLVRKVDLIAARQSYKVPVTVKVGNADVIRSASFTRVSTTLALDSLGFARQVPEFNLSRLVAGASEDKTLDALPEPEIDAEVALVTRAFRAGEPVAGAALALTDEDVLPQVVDAWRAPRRRGSAPAPVEAARLLLSDGLRATTPHAPRALAAALPAGAPPATRSLLGQSLPGTLPQAAQAFTEPAADPFSKLVVRMVPENISALARSETGSDMRLTETVTVIGEGADSVLQALRKAGASPEEARALATQLSRMEGGVVAPNNRLKISLQPLEPGRAPSIVRIEIFADEQKLAALGRRDDGRFVPFETSARPARRSRPRDDDEEEGGLTLFASIHETLRRHAIAPTVIDQIVKVIFFDVDLQRRVTAGDGLELLLQDDETDKARSDLALVALNIGGVKRRFYRFPIAREDVVEYLDAEGRSAKQFLIRKPLDDGELRSTFGWRRHPILGYSRMHNGVDWADRIGTPIRAAGNGTVLRAEWDSGGYGRRIELEHNNGYVTTYSHLSAFAPGIVEGAKVRQGQVIGRLGSTGLSTGPHLHYEVMINGRFQDPLTIKLPRGRELNGAQLAEFKRERDRIEDILGKAPGSAEGRAETAKR